MRAELEQLMPCAEAISGTTNCRRRGVGYVLYKSGFEAEACNYATDGCICVDGSLRLGIGTCNATHAEIRALEALREVIESAKKKYFRHAKYIEIRNRVNSAPLYAVGTYSPCLNCANALLEAGLTHILVKEVYEQGILDYLEERGVTVYVQNS